MSALRSPKLRWLGLLAGLLLACGLPGLSSGSGPITQLTPKAQQVYYGPALCGDTALTVEIAVDAQAAPSEVGVQYRVVGARTGPWQQVPATLSGPNTYVAVLPVPDDAASLLGGQNGRLEFRAYAADAQGTVRTFPAQGTQEVPVQPCTQQAVAVGQDVTPPTIGQVVVPSTPVFYQGTCAPNTLLVSASVVDDSGQVQVALEYWFEAGGQAGARQHMAMQPSGSVYQAQVPVAQLAANALQGRSGQMGFRIVATDAAGNQAIYPSGNAAAARVTVEPCRQQARSGAPAGGNATGGRAGQPPASGGARPANPPSSGASQPGSNTGGTGPSGPSPTNPPSNANPDPGRLSIQAQARPDVTYYGNCPAGEPTWVDIELLVDDIQRVASATVLYRYESQSQPGSGFDHQAPMQRQQGIGNFATTIDVGQDLPEHATADRMIYLVEVITTDGQTLASPTYFHPVQPCAITGDPPQPPALQILDVQASPDPVQVGLACDPGTTTLRVEAEIVPGDAVQDATVYLGLVPQPNMMPDEVYTFGLGYLGGDAFAGEADLNAWYAIDNPSSGFLAVTVVARTYDGQEVSHGVYVSVEACQVALAVYPTIQFFVANPSIVREGDTYSLEWEVSDATCGVYLDGQAVADADFAVFTAPQVDADTEVTHVLEAYGEPCDNPTVVQDTVTITVENAPNQRISNYEILYPGQPFDLDFADGADIALQVSGANMNLITFNFAQVVWLDPYSTPSLDECRWYFIQNDPGITDTLPLTANDLGRSVCVYTGEGYVAVITIEELSDTPGGEYLVISLRSETP